MTQGHKSPHLAWHIRDINLPDHEIVEESNEKHVGRIGAEQAIKETYPGACYLHLQQGWRIIGWQDQAAGVAIIRARRLSSDTSAWNPQALPEANSRIALAAHGNYSRDTYQRTNPILDYQATVRLNREGIIEGRLTNLGSGMLAETWMDLRETVSGWEEGNLTYEYEQYADRRPGLKSQSIEIPTTGVLLQINLPWFNNQRAHRRIAVALLDLLCYDQSIPRKDVAWTDEGIMSTNDLGGREPMDNSVLIYDTVYGGMRLTAELYDNLPEYAQRIYKANLQSNGNRTVRNAKGEYLPDEFLLFNEFVEGLFNDSSNALSIRTAR